MTNPFDASQFADVGFDISHNNSGLDFKALWDSGRRVLMHKITEGTDFIDLSFVPHLQAIKGAEVNFSLAIYHFAHDEDPAGQVHFMVDTFTDQCLKLGYTPEVLFMIDAERGNNPPTPQTVIDMVAELTAEGIPNPMIYCGYDFFSTKSTALSECSHFLAEYGSHPVSAVPWRRPDAIFGWDWWQYTGDGIGPWVKDIMGGSHNMDLSCFNLAKNSAGFAEWWTTELAKIQLGS